MDALLLSLILCLSIEADGALARHYASLSRSRAGIALIALTTTAIAVSAIASLGGAWLRLMLTPEARGVFLAIALVLTGGGLFFRSPQSVKNGSSLMVLAKMIGAGAGSNAALLIAATACWFADPWMAGIGGALGCVAGCVVGREIVPGHEKPMRLLRYALGSALLLTAFLLAMDALRLM